VAVVDIEVYSDVVCPWCYVGRRRLEAAVQQLQGKHEVRVTWKPYQLNPWVPAEGMDRAEYRKMKFGSAERSSGMDTRLVDAGRGEGIELAFDRIKRTPNTLAAHRLIWWAEQQGRQIEMVDTLFQGYFTDGKDIGDIAQLTELAAIAGLDAEAVSSFLATEDGLEEVQAEEEAGRKLGIDGVPFFLLAGKYGVSGAQPAEVLVDVIERVVELESPKKPELLAVGASAMGATCSVDDPENC
jgi:predicted DsbA family dithiol-disulfide isomerase